MLREIAARASSGVHQTFWAGYCAIFDQRDFTERSWVPWSAWPFDEKAIKPYYQETASPSQYCLL
jgi:hypothetical protein